MKFFRPTLVDPYPLSSSITLHFFFVSFVLLLQSLEKFLASAYGKLNRLYASVSLLETVLKVDIKRVASARDSSHVPRNSLDSLNHRVES